jgi:uncharacterized protein YeaO (DUF488 family)
MVLIKRVYEPLAATDGARFLIDRLWPRGVKKEALALTAWLKDASPSAELRNWFHHDPARWNEFRHRYLAELEQNPVGWLPLLEAARQGAVTLLYSAHDSEHNNAVVLKEFLDKQLSTKAKG